MPQSHLRWLAHVSCQTASCAFKLRAVRELRHPWGMPQARRLPPSGRVRVGNTCLKPVAHARGWVLCFGRFSLDRRNLPAVISFQYFGAGQIQTIWRCDLSTLGQFTEVERRWWCAVRCWGFPCGKARSAFWWKPRDRPRLGSPIFPVRSSNRVSKLTWRGGNPWKTERRPHWNEAE